MIIVNLFFSFISGLIILAMSLVFVVIDWWLLLIPRNKRYLVARKILTIPWTFIANKFLFCIRLKVIGKENLDEKRSTLYICNHQSWADVPIFLQFAPSSALSKVEVIKIPLVGLLTVYAGGIFFDREDKLSRLSIMKEIIEFFKQGHSLCYFPEGTRSKDGTLLEPNLTLVKLAYKMKIQVVPSAIEGSKNIIQKNRIYYKFFQKVVLKYGNPINPKDFNSDEEFSKACWNQVINIHNEILNLYFVKK